MGHGEEGEGTERRRCHCRSKRGNGVDSVGGGVVGWIPSFLSEVRKGCRSGVRVSVLCITFSLIEGMCWI